MPIKSDSLYAIAMGRCAFDRLGAPLRQFHSLSGRAVLHGSVTIEGPSSLAGRVLAILLGAPQRSIQGAMRFELEANQDHETWTRHFPSKRMVSTMRLEGGHIVERLGAARLAFTLHEAAGGLEMRLECMHFLGLRCPRWLQPVLRATEHGANGRLHFHITAAVPLVGRVASYRGHLNLDGIETP